jgi:hypothetical protein
MAAIQYGLHPKWYLCSSHHQIAIFQPILMCNSLKGNWLHIQEIQDGGKHVFFWNFSKKTSRAGLKNAFYYQLILNLQHFLDFFPKIQDGCHPKRF